MTVMKSPDNVKLRYKYISVLSREKELIILHVQHKSTRKSRLAFYWLIVLVTRTTALSSHVEDKNVFTVRTEDNYDLLEKRKILLFHQYLYNKIYLVTPKKSLAPKT